MITMYVVDYGLILKSSQKITYFALSDEKSIKQKSERILKKDNFEILTETNEFANNFVDKNTRSLMTKYIDMYKGIAKSIGYTIDKNDLFELSDIISESQQKIFMIKRTPKRSLNNV